MGTGLGGVTGRTVATFEGSVATAPDVPKLDRAAASLGIEASTLLTVAAELGDVREVRIDREEHGSGPVQGAVIRDGPPVPEPATTPTPRSS